MRKRDLAVGTVFGQLVVCAVDMRHVLCKCACGASVRVQRNNLFSGNTRSCGCSRGEKHGEADRSTEYTIWMKLKERCLNWNFAQFKDYGGRGIWPCAAIRNSFKAFLSCVGRRPSLAHTVDRTDNAGGYWCGKCPECVKFGNAMNLRWATRTEQSRNSRHARRVAAFGEVRCIAEWSLKFGVPRAQIGRRLNRNWKPEDAVSRPVTGKRVPAEARLKPTVRRNDARVVTVGAEALTIYDWEKRYGVPALLIGKRIANGWDPDRAVSEPSAQSSVNWITVGGVTASAADWSRRGGFTLSLIYHRRRRGESWEDAVRPKGAPKKCL